MGSQLNRSTWSKRTAYMQKHSQELTLNVTVWSERIKSLVLRNLPLSESYKDAHLFDDGCFEAPWEPAEQ